MDKRIEVIEKSAVAAVEMAIPLAGLFGFFGFVS
jgi:hypothetical protein